MDAQRSEGGTSRKRLRGAEIIETAGNRNTKTTSHSSDKARKNQEDTFREIGLTEDFALDATVAYSINSSRALVVVIGLGKPSASSPSAHELRRCLARNEAR